MIEFLLDRFTGGKGEPIHPTTALRVGVSERLLTNDNGSGKSVHRVFVWGGSLIGPEKNAYGQLACYQLKMPPLAIPIYGGVELHGRTASFVINQDQTLNVAVNTHLLRRNEIDQVERVIVTKDRPSFISRGLFIEPHAAEVFLEESEEFGSGPMLTFKETRYKNQETGYGQFPLTDLSSLVDFRPQELGLKLSRDMLNASQQAQFDNLQQELASLQAMRENLAKEAAIKKAELDEERRQIERERAALEKKYQSLN